MAPVYPLSPRRTGGGPPQSACYWPECRTSIKILAASIVSHLSNRRQKTDPPFFPASSSLRHLPGTCSAAFDMIRLSFGLLLVLLALPARGRETEFAIDVMSVLSKAGCNAGTCHGNLNGKGGFKLSLRGQDSQFDFDSLVLASRGRRVHPSVPELSLFLQKASGGVAHRGGIRFDTQSKEYQLLIDWLRHGAKGPSSKAPTLIGLEVQPSEAIVVSPADKLQVHVDAFFSDGTSRDVTDRACYELSNLNASVDADGCVSRTQFGETTLIVRYLQKQIPVPIAFTAARPDFQWSDPPVNNEIDEYVFAKLKRLRINPSSLSGDVVFVRRAYLDAIGRGPTAAEARSFIQDDRGDKRSQSDRPTAVAI